MQTSANIIAVPFQFLIGQITIVRHVYNGVTFLSSTVLINSTENLYFGNPVVAQVFKKYCVFGEALKVHYHVHKSPPFLHNMSQLNPQHDFICGKGKEIPLEGLTDPKVSRMLRLLDFETFGT
jgi:hypothetical protein